MIESRIIVLDNIHILQVREGLNSYAALSKYTGINVNTIKSWFSTKNTIPKLSTLDNFCDSFNIYTVDLFIPTSTFQHRSSRPNDSRTCFIQNFKSECIKKNYFKLEEMLSLCYDGFSTDTLKSYLRSTHGRTIPLANLDFLAERLEIETYKLLLPQEVAYAT